MDAGITYFFQSIQLGRNPDSLIHMVLQRELPRIIERHCDGQMPSECLLAEIGDFLAIVMDILSEVANVAVQGNYISGHWDGRGATLEQESDLHTTDYLDDKREGLIQITSKLQDTALSVHEIWAKTPSYPTKVDSLEDYPEQSSAGPSHNFMASRHSNMQEGWGTRSNVSDFQHHDSPDHNYGQESPTTNDGREEEYSGVPSIEQLRVRGKGNHTCPYKQCKKGGVDQDGRIRIFSRNSEFRAHLLKHEKPYKCDLSGCPNNGKGFARSDQLARHKENVPHST